MDVLQAACVHLGITVDQVLSHRVYPDGIALVVDRGIKGCPKYEIGRSAIALAIADEAPAMASEAAAPRDDGRSASGLAIAEETPAMASEAAARVVITDPPATEMARTMAKKSRIELVMVEGTGAGGRITKRDVERAIAARKEG